MHCLAGSSCSLYSEGQPDGGGLDSYAFVLDCRSLFFGTRGIRPAWCSATRTLETTNSFAVKHGFGSDVMHGYRLACYRVAADPSLDDDPLAPGTPNLILPALLNVANHSAIVHGIVHRER